jgi:hypothetical protein
MYKLASEIFLQEHQLARCYILLAMTDIRVACHNPEMLKARTYTSGIGLVTADEIAADNYWEDNLIRPAGELRPATNQEIERIVAPPDDRNAIRLWRISDSLGAMAVKMQGRSVAYNRPSNGHSGVIDDFPGEIHPASPNTLTTSRLSMPDGQRVGLHMDIWPEDTWYSGINLGPGARYIAFVPNITLSKLDVSIKRPESPEDRAARRRALRNYVHSNQDPQNLRCYFIRLEAPTLGETGIIGYEAYANMPTDRVLHDGSTTGIPEGSNIALIRTPLLEPDLYPSLV